MNKKIISCLVSTIFLIQSVAYLPSKAVCNENHPVSKTLQQNKSQEKKSSIFKSIFLGAGIGGIIVAAVSTGLGLGYSRVSNRKSENISDDRGHNPNLGCDEDFRKHWRYDSAKEGVKRYRIQDEKINDLAKQWKREHGTPVRAIKWHSYLCWLHSSILLLFHERHYNELICNFPVQEAQHLIDNSDLQPKDKARLKFMICLSKIFNILMGDPNVPAECVDLEPTKLEKELVGDLNCIGGGYVYGYPESVITENIKYALLRIMQANCFSEQWRQMVSEAPMLDGLLAIHGTSQLMINNTPNHDYVSLFVNQEERLTLGEYWNFRELTDFIQKKSGSKTKDENSYFAKASRKKMDAELQGVRLMNQSCEVSLTSGDVENVLYRGYDELSIARERYNRSDDDCKSLTDILSEAYLKYVEFEKQKLGTPEAIETAKKLMHNMLDEIGELTKKCGFARQKEVAIGWLDVVADALVGQIIRDCYKQQYYVEQSPYILDDCWKATTIEKYVGQQLEKFPSKASEDQQLDLEKAKRLMEQWKEVRELALELNNHANGSDGGEELLIKARNLAIKLYLSFHQEQDI